jgi:hypothetical protein
MNMLDRLGKFKLQDIEHAMVQCMFIADRLKDEITESNPLAADLLDAALSHVNWWKIAEAYLEETADDEETK